MDLVVHLGAHRTGTTSFQRYARAQRAVLAARGIGFWGPWRTRSGLLNDVIGACASTDEGRRAQRRLHQNVQGAAQRGTQLLLVSDENILGSVGRCVADQALYRHAGARVAAVLAAIGRPVRLGLQCRPLDDWWTSALTYRFQRIGQWPDAAALARIASCSRGWRAVLSDIAGACPGVPITVTVHDTYAHRPAALLSVLTGQDGFPYAPPTLYWANRGPRLGPSLHTTPGTPKGAAFNTVQTARLKALYAADLAWLRAGADGLATLTEEADRARSDQTPGPVTNTRGHAYDGPAQRLAPDRREGIARAQH